MQDVFRVREPEKKSVPKKNGNEELLLLLEETTPAAALKCGCTWQFQKDGTCDVYTTFPAVKALLSLWLEVRGYGAVVVH